MLQGGILILLLPLLESRKELDENKKLKDGKKRGNDKEMESLQLNLQARRRPGGSQSYNRQKGSSHN